MMTNHHKPKVRERLSVDELLAGLAEEASELSKAALKYRRALTGENPTPMTEDDCYENLMEEIADVELYLETLDINWNHVMKIEKRKAERWIARLENG